MFKRLTWMGVGLVAGLGASKWIERKARRRLARHIPGGLRTLATGAEVRDRARELATGTLDDVRYAIGEGRRAMATREVELRLQAGRGEVRRQPPLLVPPGPGATTRPGPGAARRWPLPPTATPRT